ncbi:hypothetical protein NP233_g1945 [Leucocoprinus birnbaumii]|uniref:Putative gamma-glutamylcyclotransferase n=1 Tax=Leucocoprinus birnbaumii TaxID=56174 RepID=A0AAD5VZP9_9AGAR|nr:hypothetical protein NP233_g1945 [Leucocoprinus birnbaumii]
MTRETGTLNAFFYGTLMHPKILTRVIGNDGSHLQICPAVLKEFTRHKVKMEEYPGVVPIAQSGEHLLKGRELSDEDTSVRGTLVTGLTAKDIRCLDFFEGPEYRRDPVKAYPLGPLANISTYLFQFKELLPSKPPPLPRGSELLAAIDADTYVFLELDKLEAEPWDFSGFVEQNAWKWYGTVEDGLVDYVAVVDERRQRGEFEMGSM